MNNPELKNKGLLPRYTVLKNDGSEISPDARYFVLRYDKSGSDPIHTSASRDALRIYAGAIKDHLPKLSEDLTSVLISLGHIPPVDSLKVYRITAGEVAHVAADDELSAIREYMETTTSEIQDIESISEVPFWTWTDFKIHYPDGDGETDGPLYKTLSEVMEDVTSTSYLCSSEY
jgi:hypothetical protein